MRMPWEEMTTTMKCGLVHVPVFSWLSWVCNLYSQCSCSRHAASSPPGPPESSQDFAGLRHGRPPKEAEGVPQMRPLRAHEFPQPLGGLSGDGGPGTHGKAGLRLLDSCV